MALFKALAALGVRATGRALSAHVVPDSLTPSWKTKKAVSTGYNLLKSATRKTGKEKSKKPNSKPYQSPALAGVSRPKPKAPAKKFDKNAWSMGRTMPVANGSDNLPPRPRADMERAEYERSSFNQRKPSPRPSLASLRLQQAKDVVKHPKIVARMGLDLLKLDYQKKKETFLSNLKHAVKTARIIKRQP